MIRQFLSTSGAIRGICHRTRIPASRCGSRRCQRAPIRVRCPTVVVIAPAPELDRVSNVIRGFNDRWPEWLVPAGFIARTADRRQY
jgi:hypothetical protein